MSFDEEPRGPHDECAHEIHELQQKLKASESACVELRKLLGGQLSIYELSEVQNAIEIGRLNIKLARKLAVARDCLERIVAAGPTYGEAAELTISLAHRALKKINS